MPPAALIPAALPKLSAWLREHTQGELAVALEIQQSAVSLWARGLSRPSGHMREGVELVTGIPAREWNTPEELRHLERVKRRLSKARRASTGEQPAARRPAVVDADRPSWTGTEG